MKNIYIYLTTSQFKEIITILAGINRMNAAFKNLTYAELCAYQKAFLKITIRYQTDRTIVFQKKPKRYSFSPPAAEVICKIFDIGIGKQVTITPYMEVTVR